MNGSFHEGVFKILQTVKSAGVTVALLIPPHKAALIDGALRALGMKTAYPDLADNGVVRLPKQCKAVVTDITYIAKLNGAGLKNFTALFKKRKLPNIPIFTDHELLDSKTVKEIYRTFSGAPITVDIPDTLKTGGKTDKVKSFFQKTLFRKKTPASVEIKIEYTADRVISSNTAYCVTGAENAIHLLGCDGALYASVAAACIGCGVPDEDAALTAAVTIRAGSKRALSVTNGPGSFTPVFIDSLFQIKRDYIYQIKCEEIRDQENEQNHFRLHPDNLIATANNHFS